MIATPSFEGRPDAKYVMSACGTHALLQEHGVGCHLAILGGSPFIAEARNVLASAALARPEVTDLFFIDDDLGWPPEKVLEFLRRPEEVVAGVYPKKQEGGGWPSTVEEPRVKRNGLLRASLVPCGFMRIKRSALERMKAVVQSYKDPNFGDGDIWNFFEARVVDLEMEVLRSHNLDTLSRDDAIHFLRHSLGLSLGPHIMQFWGEDYWFCTRWRELGGECWVDPNIDFVHVGTKRHSGNFASTLK